LKESQRKSKTFELPDFSEMFENVFNFVRDLFGGGTESDQKAAKNLITDSLSKAFDAAKQGIYSFVAGAIDTLMAIVQGIGNIPGARALAGGVIESSLVSLAKAKESMAKTLGVTPSTEQTTPGISAIGTPGPSSEAVTPTTPAPAGTGIASATAVVSAPQTDASQTTVVVNQQNNGGDAPGQALRGVN